MASQSHVLFSNRVTCVNVWESNGVQQCAYPEAVVSVAFSPYCSESAPVNSFNQVLRVSGSAVALSNASGGVCIFFKNETTLNDFAQSLNIVLPVIATAVDREHSAVFDGASTSEDMMDSFLSELSTTLWNEVSDVIVDNDGDVELDWDIVDM
uniref:Transcriptional repressor rco-1 n=1 Tax=Ganoderma boninense TaxID=34458 RepID=A0A5K1JUU3_9APHY|nr:Transcriptional repressor rco-1 [Ganoderma boninense]